MSVIESVLVYLGKFQLFDSVSDTFTILVGFVVIGIPLALQNAKSDRDKYRNKKLVKRFTTGRLITPNSLIWLTIIYVLFALSNKFLGVRYPNVAEGFLTLYFVALLISAAYFFTRFYVRVTTSTHKFILELLGIKSKRTKGYVLKEYLLKLVRKFSGWKEPKKDDSLQYYLQLTDDASLEAGFELLAEQFRTHGHIPVYEDILTTFYKCLRSDTKANPKRKAFAISEYWKCLVSVVKTSFQKHEASLSFRSQRLIGCLIREIGKNASVQKELGSINFNTYQELYEVGRWLSQQSNEGVKVALSAEWIKELFYFKYEEKPFTNCAEFSLEVFKIYESIARLVVEETPENIIKLYTNLAEALPHSVDEQVFPGALATSKSWLYEFWQYFNSLEFNLVQTKSLNDKKNFLANGDAYVKFGKYGVSEMLTPVELEEQLALIQEDQLFLKALVSQAKYTVLMFVALLAFYRRWQELFECLDWRQPDGSNVKYTGASVIAEDVSQLELDLEKYYGSIEGAWFVDRHTASRFLLKGAAALLIAYFKRSKKNPMLFQGTTKQKVALHIGIVNGLNMQLSDLKKEAYFARDRQVISQLIIAMEASLESLELAKSNFSRVSQLSAEQKLDFYRAVESAWFSLDGKLGLYDIFELKYTSEIVGEPVEVIKSQPKYMTDVGTNYGRFIATHSHNWLIVNVINLLKVKGVTDNLKQIHDFRNLTVIGELTQLNKLGFEKVKFSHILKHESEDNWKGVVARNSPLIFVNNDLFSLKLTKNSAMDGNIPLFCFFECLNNHSANFSVEAYFELVGFESGVWKMDG